MAIPVKPNGCHHGALSIAERRSTLTKKHPPPDEQPVKLSEDLEENPGIGQSKGLFARAGSKDAELIEGDNTVEGDIEDDASLGPGAEGELGRENE